MKFSTIALSAAAVLVSVSSRPVKRDVDPNLVPQFGVQAGVNPDGTGNCDGIDGANGKPILIPCSCPPDRDTFISDLNTNVNLGHVSTNPSVAVTFPTDNSTQSQLARIEAAIVTLQNLNGPGVGCPASSTTFSAQQQAIQNGANNDAAAPPPATTAAAPPPPATTAAAAPPATSSATASTSGGVDPNLVPQFGVQAGVNPDGTGNCDGIDGANGQPILIPCSCPPDRDTFIQDLSANVAAGKAVNNPSVAVTFPTDNSTQSQLARIEAAIVTLQNLNGPGVGCPASSTTFSAQQQAIQDGTNVAVAAPPPATTAAAPPPPATTAAATPPAASSAAASTSGGVDPSLVPQFGVQAGVNPSGTGNCDGIDGANGQPILIPCSCPPDRDTFIQDLSANVAAGKAVNNPSVAVSFPTDGSLQSQITRLQASLVTLQNLHGSGVGCPASSTTFVAQQQALQNQLNAQ
ncbi:hypothetical protein CERSUDRAFT_118386 [Gelatoporia subvermispora B]|uniref:Uncharacterized protein n=1 Tax=Ceriporiopsis subvermispora (strain B) TaxID=914234 RepID=M2R443_CERS8|nr:hypothetical protein CERSUDRAFT_118386 [Gelatoporia subvermispora B]